MFKAFWDFPWPKTRPHRLKAAKKHLFEHTKWSGNNFGKNLFFRPGDPGGPTVGPRSARAVLPSGYRNDHWYGVLGVRLGDSEGWKPPKVGGCGWTKCPRNWILSHVAQDTVRAWFRGVSAHGADFGAFWRLFGPFLGHIVELKGTRRLFDTVKSSRTCSVATVSLRLAVLTGFWGRFGPKKAVLGHKMRSFGRAPHDLAPTPRGATGEFLGQNLDLARAPPRLRDG